MTEFQVWDSAALGERAQLRGVAKKLGERHFGGDDFDLSALAHRFDAAAFAVDRARDIAHEFLGRHHFQFHDGFKDDRLRLLECVLKRVDSGQFEGDL